MGYITKDQFAHKQKYDDWDAFIAANEYPTEDALDEMIEEMSTLMNEEIGTLGTDITAAKYLTLLRNICYRGIIMMIDDEQARAQEERRSIFNPRDYMFERDRNRLRTIGHALKKRKRGVWVF
ncbi:MAG: hypothetical protein OEL89_00045 [Candidatus Peregrinibacteria bacterium]|nr:hypothetical protein [Candidatus Peregrinibacteria bacterium]